MTKKKYEIDINIGGRKELKETIKDIETLDENIMASKFSSKLAKMFESASDSIKGFGKENDYMLKAMSKVVPELNVKTKKLSDITETYVLQYKKQIDQIEKLTKNKYSSDIKYTEESQKIYTDYFLKQQQLHSNNLKKLIEIHEEKKKYLSEYDTRNKALQKEVEKSLKIIKTDDEEKEAAKLIAELKNLSDLKKDANLSDIVIQKEFIKEEETLQTNRNKRITDLEASALEHNKHNFLGLNTIKKEESKANYEAIKQLRLKNIEDAKEESDKIAAAYDEMAKAFEKGSTGEAVILEEKKNKLYAINEQILKDESAVHNSRKAYNDALVKQNADTITKLTEHTTQLKEGMASIQSGYSAIMNEWVRDISERLTKVSAEYTEIVAKHKDSPVSWDLQSQG